MIVDEFVSMGGKDIGVLLYEYLIVLFGVCMLMILCMYVDLK